MKILVTGAKGFVGRNLCSQLNNIKTGKAKCYGDLQIDEVFEYDLNSTMEQLDAWCSECDFVFNLAGVNRPQNPEEFMAGNFGFASTLLDTLKKHGNKAPVMLSSSAQASLSGRFGNSEYGRSKKAGFILSGIDTKGLLQSVDTAVELVKNGDYGTPVPDYTDENVSTKVVKIIQSYVGVVNKMVWRKEL